MSTKIHFQIRNGADETSPLQGRYCNPYNQPTMITSEGSTMWIRFHSDDSDNGKGFSAAYKIGKTTVVISDYCRVINCKF